MTFLTHEALDLLPLIRQVSAPDHGGVASFLGVVRDHHEGQAVVGLEYSAYEAMAEAECGRIVAEVEARWAVRVALRHRLGRLTVGDAAVAIAVGGGHRAVAFTACRHVLEEVKRRVPIWKHEQYADGTAAWVDPTRTRLPAERGER